MSKSKNKQQIATLEASLGKLEEAFKTKRITEEKYLADKADLEEKYNYAKYNISTTQKNGVKFIQQQFAKKFGEDHVLSNTMELGDLAKTARFVLLGFLKSEDPKLQAFALQMLSKPLAASGLAIDCNMTALYKSTQDLDAALKLRKLMEKDPEAKPKVITETVFFEDSEYFLESKDDNSTDSGQQ